MQHDEIDLPLCITDKGNNKILRALLKKESMYESALLQNIDMDRKTLFYHLDNLIGTGLVIKESPVIKEQRDGGTLSENTYSLNMQIYREAVYQLFERLNSSSRGYIDIRDYMIPSFYEDN